MDDVCIPESHIGRTSERAGPGPGAQGPFLSVADSARALCLSPSTVRRYVRDHGRHLRVVHRGRALRIALGSIPTLARIRDLHGAHLPRHEIDAALAARPGAAHVAAETLPATVADGDGNAAAAIGKLQAQLSQLREEMRENEIVMRQTLSSVLFLLDKYNKDVQCYVTEERMANRERDLCIARQDDAIRGLTGPSKPRGGLRGFVRAVLGRLFAPARLGAAEN